MRYLTLSAILALLATLAGVLVASANPYNGNPWDWHSDPGVQLLLQQNLIGTVSTAGDPVRCLQRPVPGEHKRGR